MTKGKLFRAWGAIAASLALVLTMAAPAHADTGGGQGGSGGSGSVGGYGHWVGAWSSPGSSAWDKFSGAGSWNKDYAVAKAGGANLVNLCKVSDAIWFFAENGSSRGEHNFYDGFYGARTLDDGANQLRGLGYGIPDAWGNFAADWTNPGVRASVDNPYIIICSAAIGLTEKPPEKMTWQRNFSETTNSNYTKLSPINYSTEVKKQFAPAGSPEFKNPLAVAKTTSFGGVYNRVLKGETFTPANLEKLVNEALEKDKNFARPTVKLDATNAKAFASGMVLNVIQFRNLASVSTTSTTVKDYRENCTRERTWNMNTQNWNPWGGDVCSGKTETGSRTTYASSVSGRSAENIGFYQLLSVHCNPGQLAALLNSSPSLSKVSGTVGGSNSAVVTTTPVAKVPVESQKLLGSKTNTVPAQNVTASDPFYKQQCPWDCIASPVPGDGASTANDATNNVRNTGSLVPGTLYGATYDNSNGNLFEMFRDNEVRKVKVDVWYPRSGDGITYNGQAATETTVNVWGGSSPAPVGNDGVNTTFSTTEKPTSASVLKFKTVNNTEGEVEYYRNTTPGSLNTVYVGSPWASDADKPVVFNMTWKYSPELAVNVPTDLGLSGSGASIGGTTEVKTPVPGVCESRFGTEKGNTNGTLVAGGSTSPIVVRDAKIPQNDQGNLVLRFIRSVAN